jgi:glycerophosphoryl diester phosphodiesterase
MCRSPGTALTTAEVLALPLRDTTRGRVYPPLFSEVVDTLKTLILDEGRRFMIEIDFKPHGDDTERAVASLVEIIEAQEAELGEQIYDHFFVSSFFPNVLAEIRRHSDKIVTALGVNSDPPTDVMAARAVIKAAHYIMKRYDVRILEPNHCLLTEDFVDSWAERGILINSYTVNTACEKEYVNRLPVAYTTNCPDGTCQPDASDLVLEKRNWCSLCD